MTMFFSSPSHYIQGRGEISNLGEYASEFGSNAMVIISKGGYERLGDEVEMSLLENAILGDYEFFGGECSEKEIARILDMTLSCKSQVVIGIGGGKIIDTAIEHLQPVVDAICADDMIGHMVTVADPQSIYEAMIQADARGKAALGA